MVQILSLWQILASLQKGYVLAGGMDEVRIYNWGLS